MVSASLNVQRFMRRKNVAFLFDSKGKFFRFFKVLGMGRKAMKKTTVQFLNDFKYSLP